MSKIDLDKYYTPPELAKRLIDKTYEIIGKENITEIIEPSAGNGSFSKQIPNCIAYDIEPEDQSIIKQDFLKLKLSYKKGRLIIGNPPFGERLNTAIDFYDASVQMCDYIAFVLPISQYKNRFKLYKFDLVYSEDLGETEYSNRKLHCCFNIYKRPETGMVNGKPEVSKDFKLIEYRRKNQVRIPPNFDYGICTWGNGSIGKEPEYIGQYAQEIYVYLKDKKHLSKLKSVLSRENLLKDFDDIAMKRISKIRLEEYIVKNIPELKGKKKKKLF